MSSRSGVARGALSIEIAQAGATVLGVDPGEFRIEFASRKRAQRFPHLVDRRIPSRRCDDPSAGLIFDVIVSKHTFEQVEDLTSLLKGSCRRLEPGGQMYMGFGTLYYSPFGDHGRTGLRCYGRMQSCPCVLCVRPPPDTTAILCALWWTSGSMAIGRTSSGLPSTTADYGCATSPTTRAQAPAGRLLKGSRALPAYSTDSPPSASTPFWKRDAPCTRHAGDAGALKPASGGTRSCSHRSRASPGRRVPPDSDARRVRIPRQAGGCRRPRSTPCSRARSRIQ